MSPHCVCINLNALRLQKSFTRVELFTEKSCLVNFTGYYCKVSRGNSAIFLVRYLYLSESLNKRCRQLPNMKNIRFVQFLIV